MDRPKIAFRCDGDERVGAGHVARCLPLAAAFSRAGWAATFIGAYGGLAGWLLARGGARTASSEGRGAPAGIDPGRWTAAIVDSYNAPEEELCSLAGLMPMATLAEARRCEAAGILVDYHLDRAGEEAAPRLLPGPGYAPVDPRFADARRSRDVVNRVLVTVGGSERARRLTPALIGTVLRVFPSARVTLASGGDVPAGDRVDKLPFPSSLLDVVRGVDLAVSAAGFTAYELACAGVPAVLFPAAENQRRVVAGCTQAGVAIGVDPDDSASGSEVANAIEQLVDPALRARLAAAGPQVVDGRGAERTVAALEARWLGRSLG